MNNPVARTISSQLAVQLRERIVAGTYAPGTQLLQDGIASEFGVSKIPVREALVQLQSEGLVDIFAHRGFQVRPLSKAEFEEVFRLRLQIEPAAIVTGSRQASDTDREAARVALKHLNATDDLRDSAMLNRKFHMALVVPSVQPLTAEILGRLHMLSQRYTQVHLSPRGRLKRATREHSDLFETWAARKFKQASELTRAHIAATHDDLAKTL